jgi:uncharacterized protein YhjY with autotransporter beta-barrel domain
MNSRDLAPPLASSRPASAACTALVLAIASLAPQGAHAQSSEPVLNDNQVSMDAAIRQVCPQLAVLVRNAAATTAESDLFVRCNRVINTTGGIDSQSPALQALTAEEANAARTNTIEIGTASQTSILGRLAMLRNAGGAAALASVSAPGQMQFSFTGGASGDESGLSAGRLGVYLQGRLGTGDKERTRFEAGYDVDTLGFSGGADYRFTDSLVAGVALAYSEAESDFTRDSTGTKIDGGFDSDGVTFSLYGSWYGERAYVDLIASYGDVDFDSTRSIVYTVDAPAGMVGDVVLPTTDSVNRIARGRTSGDTVSVGLSAGMDWARGPWLFGPLVAVNYLDLSVDGFSESGADELNLLYDDQSAESLQLQLGLNLAYTVSTSRGVVVPYGSVVFISEQKDDQDSFRLRYLSDPCARADSGVTTCSFFDVTSDDPDTSFLRWNVGLSAVLANDFSAYVDYTSIASLDSISYGEVTVGVRYQFR